MFADTHISIIFQRDGTFEMFVTGEGDGLTYQWQYLAPGGTKWANFGRRDWFTSFWPSIEDEGCSIRCALTDHNGTIMFSEVVVFCANEHVPPYWGEYYYDDM